MNKKQKIEIEVSKKDLLFFKKASKKYQFEMSKFFRSCVLQKLEDMEDEEAMKKALKVLEGIKSGKRKTISLDEFKRGISSEISSKNR